MAALAPQLNPAQAKRAWDRLIAYWAEPLSRMKTFGQPSSALTPLAIRLNAVDVSSACNAMIAILEGSSQAEAQDIAQNGLAALEGKMDPALRKIAFDALIESLKKSPFINVVALKAFAPRLAPAQVKRLADALIPIFKKTPPLGADLLAAIADRMEPEQAAEALDALISVPSVPSESWEGAEWGIAAFQCLSDRLPSQEILRVGDRLIQALEKSIKEGVSPPVIDAWRAIAPRLEAKQVKRVTNAIITGQASWIDRLTPRPQPAEAKHVAEVLVGTLERGSGQPLQEAISSLPALADRFEPMQARRAENALLKILEKQIDVPFQPLCRGLGLLAPRLEPVEASRCWDLVVAVLPEIRYFGSWEPENLGPLAARIESAHAQPALHSLTVLVETSTGSGGLRVASAGLKALAPRLQPAEAELAWQAEITAMTRMPYLFSKPVADLGPLASSMDSRGVNRAANLLIANLSTSPQIGTWGLAALASRLEPAAAKRVADALIDLWAKPNAKEVVRIPEEFVELACRLDDEMRDKLLFAIVVASPPGYGGLGASTVGLNAVRSISSPRPIVQLLSRPNCLGPERECLLKRFEELVLYGGKPVFLKVKASKGNERSMDQSPPRQFRDLHDVASWIQKNWPDFDLEAICPVTWPGESHDTRSTGSR
jgi:hypothetical protein